MDLGPWTLDSNQTPTVDTILTLGKMSHLIGAFVYQLGHGPLKAERRVRFPYALPVFARSHARAKTEEKAASYATTQERSNQVFIIPPTRSILGSAQKYLRVIFEQTLKIVAMISRFRPSPTVPR